MTCTTSTAPTTLVVRRATRADGAALADLAALDGARPLAGDALVAGLDGRLVAAVSLADGRTVADPFVHTAAAVAALRAWSAPATRRRRARSARALGLLGLRRLRPV